MPLPKASDFREKTDEEIAKDLGNFGKELATLQDTKYGRRKSLRRLIARIQTVMGERSRAAAKAKPQEAGKKTAAQAKKQPAPAEKQAVVSGKARQYKAKGAKGPAKAPRQAQKPKAVAKAKK